MPGKLWGEEMDHFPEVQLPESRVLIIITGMCELQDMMTLLFEH